MSQSQAAAKIYYQEGEKKTETNVYKIQQEEHN